MSQNELCEWVLWTEQCPARILFGNTIPPGALRVIVFRVKAFKGVIKSRPLGRAIDPILLMSF